MYAAGAIFDLAYLLYLQFTVWSINLLKIGSEAMNNNFAPDGDRIWLDMVRLTYYLDSSSECSNAFSFNLRILNLRTIKRGPNH